MTSKNNRRQSAPATPSSPALSPEIRGMLIEQPEEVVVAAETEATESIKSATAQAVATQEWLMTYPLNEIYAIGITPPKNLESAVILFDRHGGILPLASITVNATTTETDILRGSKRLVAAILNNLARSKTLV